jgi:hypothetical protein
MSGHTLLITAKELIDKKVICIEEIIKINSQIKNIENSLNNHFKDLVSITDKEIIILNKLLEKIEFAQNCLETETIIQNSLSSLCHHIIVEDMIDITPEISKNIRYCSICETTFE